MLCGAVLRCTAPGSSAAPQSHENPPESWSLPRTVSPIAAAPFWLTGTSGDPRGSTGAGLTLKEPVDEGAWERGILQRTRR